ncbi:unnamed protein product [Dimorphilus gyrociliatus]|uniref:G-protein coupled receptors family 1 profile domain-containing protein n=1 Tax=Dimorphilus gyrociliatus TaxID=2664684 RepID=A0A7I8WCG9_9ANNE|nr:unnamed protein product [Dimorphilus gyrociliatus]
MYCILYRIYTLRNTIGMIILLWTICFLLEMPNFDFINWNNHSFDKKSMTCLWDRTYAHSYSIFFITVGVVFPIILIAFCYLKIFLHVRQAKRRIMAAKKGQEAVESASAEREKRNSMRLARTLFVIFVVFASCWLPYGAVILYDKDDKLPLEVHVFVLIIAHFNSSCNSILYGVMNKHFRQSYVQLLGIHHLAYHMCKVRMYSYKHEERDAQSTVMTNNKISQKTFIKS